MRNEPSESGFVQREQLTPMEEEMAHQDRIIKYLRDKLDLVKKRTPYPQFCKHPNRCANTGRCQADWVCND